MEIARLPLAAMFDALRHDGAPPLYYLLLHGWMKLFGTGDVAARSLSAVFSVATLPVVFTAARRRGGQVVGVSAAVLFATSPYAIRYATEARMYSLVALLVGLGWLALHRAVTKPSAANLTAVAVTSGLLVLSHYWSFYVLVAVGLVGAVTWRRRVVLASTLARIAGAMGAGVALFFAPWAPTFLFQLGHTGTPWGTPPGPIEVAFTTLVDLGGGPYPEGQALAAVLAGLAVLGLLGRALDGRRIELDLTTVPGVRGDAAVAAITVLLGVGVGAVTASAWASRYNSVAFPLVVVVAAAGLRALADRRLAATVLVVAAALGVVGGARNFVTDRTQAAATAHTLAAAGARPGDWVLYCPDQIAPDVQRVLPAGLVQVTYPGFASPRLIDWADYEDRVAAADPVAFATEALRRAGDKPIFYVWMPGYRTHAKRCERINDTLAGGSRGSRQLQEPDSDVFERQVVWVHPERL